MNINYKQYSDEFGLIKGFFFFLYVLGYKALTKIIVRFIRRNVKLNDHIIVFESSPDYSDNSKALSDFLIANKYTDYYKIYWSVNDPKLLKEPPKIANITFIEKKNKFHVDKISSAIIVNRAKYMITTHGFPMPLYKRRNGQHYIWLWHGSSFKGKTENEDNGKKNRHGEFGFILVAGPLFVKPKSYFFNVDERFICPLGFPRYDWLLKKTTNALILKHDFCKDNERLLIWMPTFRNHPEGIYGSIQELSTFPLIKEQTEWSYLDKFCQEKKLVIVIKIHMFQKDYEIDFSKFKNIKIITNEVFDKENVNMYEFLAVTDALITDYSSVGIDYLLVNKPIAYTLDDFEIYKNKRGFVVEDPRKFMPGHHLYKYSDLLTFLEDISKGKDMYESQRKQMYGVAIHKSNNYCKEIADKIGLKQN